MAFRRVTATRVVVSAWALLLGAVVALALSSGAFAAGPKASNRISPHPPVPLPPTTTTTTATTTTTTTSAAFTTTATGGRLPRTGLDLGPELTGAALLLGAGAALGAAGRSGRRRRAGGGG